MKFLIPLFALSLALNAEIKLPQNFSSSFVQTITNEKGKVIKYEGDVLYKSIHEILENPQGQGSSEYTRNLFKWSYTKPTQKEVCTDGIQLTVVDHDLEQVANYYIEENINLEEILKVAQRLSTTTYKATYKEVEYLITLDKIGQLQKIVYVDNLDNGVKIIFKYMNYNTTIEDTKLECHAPKDYDIIKG